MMRIELDNVLLAGDTAVAALVKRSSHAWRDGTSLSGYGRKEPVAVLVRRHGKTQAFELEGSPIALDDFERRYEGRLAAFEIRVDGSADAK